MKDREFIQMSVKFLNYSFEGAIKYKYLTDVEKEFCTKKQYKQILKYIEKNEEIL